MEEQTKTATGGQSAAQGDGNGNRGVTLATTLNGETTRKEVRFHTPTLLAEVQALDDAASVEVVAHGGPDGKQEQVLLKGTKAEAVTALKGSIVKPGDIIPQFQHLVRFLVDHSNLKAVGVEVVLTDDAGDVAGGGFVSTAPDCTTAEAVALVNCGDANIDEFVSKAKLSVPGRSGRPVEKGVIVTPTPDEVRKLG